MLQQEHETHRMMKMSLSKNRSELVVNGQRIFVGFNILNNDTFTNLLIKILGSVTSVPDEKLAAGRSIVPFPEEKILK